MEAWDSLSKNTLGLRLAQIGPRDFSYLSIVPCDIYTFQNNEFHLSLPKGSHVNKDILKALVLDGHWRFFALFEDFEKIKESHQQELVKMSRSLSVGNTVLNAKKLLNLMTMNLSYLYKDPANDETLNLQFQSAKNLALFLLSNPKLQREMHEEVKKMNYHFTLGQPLLSSILLISFLKQTYHFSEKEMENMFLTSYLKDIGMAIVPNEIYDKEQLSSQEKKALGDHAKQSTQILEGRVQLGPAYLEMIDNHHSHSLIKPTKDDSIYKLDIIAGIETNLIASMDTISAMTSDRPYRTPLSLYEALDMVKANISKQHPHEFKHLIHFFQKFFKDTP